MSVFKTPPAKKPSKDANALTAGEIEVVLKAIKASTFQGEDLEILYNTVIKLQNQYLLLTK